jgi:dsRNA-specific ribonuclease
MAQTAADLDSVDHKTALNQFCQRYCKRPVTKEDIVYVVNRFGNQYQSIVKLNCFAGQEYAGHLGGTSKEAEKSAAEQALLAYAPTIEALGPKQDVPKGRKKLSPEELAAKKERQAAEVGNGENPAITPKTRLNSLCMKIAKRYLQKGETVYESMKVAGGFQSTVKLGALPGDWQHRCWAGEVCSTKQKAEQSAAAIALDQILRDEELAEEAAKPRERLPKQNRGKDGQGRWVWQTAGETELTRETFEGVLNGEVLEWKGSYGWVKSLTEINRESAQLRGGKIYVNRTDLQDGLESLEVGTTVQFVLYEDPAGLGGESVRVL